MWRAKILGIHIYLLSRFDWMYVESSTTKAKAKLSSWSW